jgi:integrase
MNIIIKKKTTETFLASLDNRPLNTKKQFEKAVSRFQKFCKESQNNMTPDQLCEELLVVKKQDEEQYINTLYDILQDYIDDLSKTLCGNSVKTYFSYTRGYIYHLGIRTNPQDFKMMLNFPRIQLEEKYPLNIEELRRILDYFGRNSMKKACFLAESSSGMRIGECLNVKKSDLVFKERIQIYIPASKAKNSRGRTVYISKECQRELEKYIDTLDDDDKVFYNGPTENLKVSASNMSRTLRKCLDAISLDMKYENGKYKINTHSLRAFFFTKAVRIHGENYAHRMTGHSGYLMMYDRMNDEEKLKMYMELEPELAVYDTAKAGLEMERLKIQQSNENKVLREEMETLKLQLANQGMEILKQLREQEKII